MFESIIVPPVQYFQFLLSVPKLMTFPFVLQKFDAIPNIWMLK